jgi:hypothetical protein
MQLLIRTKADNYEEITSSSATQSAWLISGNLIIVFFIIKSDQHNGLILKNYIKLFVVCIALE